ncbi:MAG TPA: hypothetical protein VLR71_07560 [Casimicrobiaceae bacterium]|nr:hypothetical protein [Casimicrobiaceae bacterium]
MIARHPLLPHSASSTTLAAAGRCRGYVMQGSGTPPFFGGRLAP